MIVKMCAKCGRVIKYPKTMCSECEEKYKLEAKERDKGYNKRYNQGRDKKYLAFYRSKEWKQLSKYYLLSKQYKCECCGKIATEVHHIKPIQTDEGFKLRLDINNLKAVCTSCHNKEHARKG